MVTFFKYISALVSSNVEMQVKELATWHHCCSCQGSQIHLQRELNADETRQCIRQPGSSLLWEGLQNLKTNVFISWGHIWYNGSANITSTLGLAFEEVVRSLPGFISVP